MHVLLVSPTVPWPPSFGGAQRTVAFARALAARHRVTLTCATPVGTKVGDVERFKQTAEEHLRPMVNRVLWGPPESWHAPAPPRRRSRVGRVLDDLLDLARNPVPFEFREIDERWTAMVAAHAAEFDAAVVRYPNMAPVVAGLPPHRVVVDADDMRFVVLERLARTKPFTTMVSLRLEARRSRRWELALFRRVAHVTACSREDLRLLKGVRATVLPNGIQPEPTDGIARDPSAVLFVGHVGWRPNIAGVRWFLDEAWPILSAAQPRATFQVVGREASATTLGVPDMPGVTYAADVASVAPWFAGATVSVVPLFEGGGTRIKILESLAYGTPVVSTRTGAAGLTEEFGEAEGLFLAESAADIAGAITRTLANPAPALEAAARGRALVLDRFSWPTILEDLAQDIEHWVWPTG